MAIHEATVAKPRRHAGGSGSSASLAPLGPVSEKSNNRALSVTRSQP